VPPPPPGGDAIPDSILGITRRRSSARLDLGLLVIHNVGRVEEAEPTKPTSEESRLRLPTEFPPVPQKLAWVAPPAKR
jgi:hypothetical protein